MKIASLVFFVMLAVMALLGSVLLDQSAQTARELAQVTQSTNRQLMDQQEQLAQVWALRWGPAYPAKHP